MKQSFTDRIIKEKNVSFFLTKETDITGKQIYTVFSVSSEKENLVSTKNFNYRKGGKIILVGTGKPPRDIVEQLKKLVFDK